MVLLKGSPVKVIKSSQYFLTGTEERSVRTLLTLEEECFSLLLFLTLLPCQCRLQGYTRLQEGISNSEAFLQHDTSACPFLFTSITCVMLSSSWTTKLLHFNISALPLRKALPLTHTTYHLESGSPVSEMVATGIHLYRQSYCTCSQSQVRGLTLQPHRPYYPCH